MNDVRERVSSNLAKLRQDRAKNRISRSKETKPAASDKIHGDLWEELKGFVEAPAPLRPIYYEPIVPVFYGDPPPPPTVNRPNVTLAALAKLYPIDRRSDGTWWIICPDFYIDAICRYNDGWESAQLRIKSVLFHAAKLTLLLSQVLQQHLLYPLKVDGAKVKVKKNEAEYNCVWYESKRDFYIALTLLNADAYSLGKVGEFNLLENLKAAMSHGRK
jgi:hypothetical protein